MTGAASPRLRATLLALLGAFLVFTVAVFALRLAVVIRYGDLVPTSGLESVVLYSLWKVQHGQPLYEWPNQPPYTVTIYNHLFYRTYAALLSVLGAVDADMLLPGRLIAAACSAIGALFTYLLIDHWSGVRRVETRCVAALLSVLVWFGSGSTAWHTLTIRPDMAAVAAATAGLWVYTRALTRSSVSAALGASALFYAAWGFKQVCIWTWAGVILHALLTRRWRMAALVALPAAILMEIQLLRHGAPYGYSILVAPTLSHYELYPWLERLGRFVVTNVLFLGIPALALVAWARSELTGRRTSVVTACLDRYGPLPLVAVLATAMGIVSLARYGSEKNHLLEGVVALGALTAVVIIAFIYGTALAPARPYRFAVLALVAAGAAFPGAQLLHAAGVPVPGVRYAATFTEADYRGRRALVEHMKTVDRPVLIIDEILAQPWHATDNRYPAFVLDPIYYGTAKEKGVLGGGGLEELVARGGFRTIVIDLKFDAAYRAALAAGYVVRPGPAGVPAPPSWRVLVKE